MARYLVVAHQTATSPLLLERCREIARGDPAAAFTILVPATHVSHALVCDEAETEATARRRAGEAAASFRAAGLRLRDAVTGVDSPVRAVADELRLHPDAHDAVVLSTLGPRTSRWLRLDVPRQVAQQSALPVLHVFEGGDDTWAATGDARRAIASPPPPEPTPPPPAEVPRMLAWVSHVPIVALLLVHAGVMVALALTIDRGFFGVEVLVLAFLGLTWLAVPFMEGRRLLR
ncbi:MAG: hypothetical protein GEU80_04665 [Dehalococcoidia bacterium]|nr:hypothetical protein [Dehalococcoidia bacterium]